MKDNDSGFMSNTDELLAISAENTDRIYRIGDLAHEFCVTLRTLRFYEDKGLINPKRAGTTRLYNNRDRIRLKLILYSKRIGFSLMEIREILQACDNSRNAKNPLASSKARFQSKLTELMAQKIEIDQAIKELSAQLASIDGPFAE